MFIASLPEVDGTLAEVIERVEREQDERMGERPGGDA
jgi:hypothetical protein